MSGYISKRKAVMAATIAILLGLEVILRLFGLRPGVLQNRFMPVKEVVYMERFVSDTVHGGLSFNRDCSECLPDGFIINRQGYRSPYDFDAHTVDSIHELGKRVVLVLGDSYTEGCCAEPIDSSFMDIGSCKALGMVLFNAGVGSTAPLHYERILHRLLDSITPDLVVVNFYMGNDLLSPDTVIPGVPQTFPIREYMWLSSTVPPFYWEKYGRTHFYDYTEAYDFYLDRFTLFGSNVGWVGRVVRRSVLISRTVLNLRNAFYLIPWYVKYHDFDHGQRTRTILERMNVYCEERGIPIFFALIPSAEGPWDGSEPEKSFADVFDGLPHAAPDMSQFSENDFDGGSSSNHYNNSGHRKHARFLMQVVDSLTTAASWNAIGPEE